MHAGLQKREARAQTMTVRGLLILFGWLRMIPFLRGTKEQETMNEEITVWMFRHDIRPANRI
jgi:hypothetical protein